MDKNIGDVKATTVTPTNSSSPSILPQHSMSVSFDSLTLSNRSAISGIIDYKSTIVESRLKLVQERLAKIKQHLYIAEQQLMHITNDASLCINNDWESQVKLLRAEKEQTAVNEYQLSEQLRRIMKLSVRNSRYNTSATKLDHTDPISDDDDDVDDSWAFADQNDH